MPSQRVRGGLYWSEHTKTWHYEVKRKSLGGKINGDTGIGSTRALAEAWLLKHKENLSAQRVGLTLPQDAPTLRKALERWEEAMGGVVNPRHLVNMRAAILTHCAKALERPLPELTNEVVETIRKDYLTTKGRGYRTGQRWEAEREHTAGGANTVLKMLRSLLNWAASLKTMGITSCPFKLKDLRPDEKHEAVLWPEQVQQALAEADRGGYDWADPDRTAPPHSATAIRLMIGLGLRETEALHAAWERLDLRRQVYVATKTKSGRKREIPIPDWLLLHLEAIRPKDVKAGLILPTAILEDGTQVPHHKTFTAKPVARIGTKLEVQGLTPHRLRATFATAHFEAGTPLSQIQQMLGHADPQTTMRYIVQRPKDQAKAQAKVAKAMGFENSPCVVPRKTKPNKLKPNNKAS